MMTAVNRAHNFRNMQCKNLALGIALVLGIIALNSINAIWSRSYQLKQAHRPNLHHQSTFLFATFTSISLIFAFPIYAFIGKQPEAFLPKCMQLIFSGITQRLPGTATQLWLDTCLVVVWTWCQGLLTEATPGHCVALGDSLLWLRLPIYIVARVADKQGFKCYYGKVVELYRLDLRSTYCTFQFESFLYSNHLTRHRTVRCLHAFAVTTGMCYTLITLLTKQ